MVPAQVPPKAVENDAACKTLVDVLERQLADIQKTSSDKAVVELLTGRTVQLIKDALETLKHSSQQEGLFAIIDKLSDIFMAVNEAGKEAKRCLILSVIENCIDVITSPAVLLIHKIELLKSFNILLENCQLSTKREILDRDHFAEKLSVLCKSIVQIGDYEVQVCIIEFIFRLVPKSMRTEYMKRVLDDSEQWLEFLDISDSRFEIDCRSFLNRLNKQNTCPMTRVYSYPAETVSIDGVKLHKPGDSGYDEFWVDMNEGSKRIGIFCDPSFLSSQQSQNSEQLWETVSIWAQDVKRYSCSAQGMFWKALIELKVGAEMIINKEPDNLTHVVTIVVARSYNFKTALEDVFKIHHKASSVDTPVHIVQKPDLPVESFTSQSTNTRTCVAQTVSQKQEERTGSNVVRAKISVPSEPMTTPASSVITSSSDPLTLWHEVQERQKLQKEHLEKVLDKSVADRKLNRCVVELRDTVQEDMRRTLRVSNMANVACYTSSDICLESHKDANDRSSAQMRITGANKNINTISDKENRADNSDTGNGTKKGVSEQTADKTSCRSRSQAKVQASEKCTNMTLHYMDARASDALEDVVSSQVTASGDIFASQVSPEKHNSAAVSSEYSSRKVNNKQIQQEYGNANAEGLRKDSCEGISSAATSNQLANTQVRSLRSRKRTCTPDVSDSNPSQLDVIPATLPGNQRPDTRQLRGNRKIQKNQKKIDVSTCEDDIVKSTFASNPEDVKLCKRKRKSPQADTGRKKDSKNNPKVVATNRKVSVVSPGTISLDDFKPSKSFRSLRSRVKKVKEMPNDAGSKKVVERMNTESTKDQNKAKRRKDKEENATPGNDKRNENNAAGINSDIQTLKEFLPARQNKEKTANEIHRKTTEDTSILSDNHDIGKKTNHTPSVPVQPGRKSVETVRTYELEKTKEVKSGDKESTMEGEVASVSGSGELFIEIETSKETGKGCDVIQETQCELSPPFVFDTEDEDTNKEPGDFVVPQKLSKTGKLNSKYPGASGDCISSAVETSASLNIENSYIFGNNTVILANCGNTSTFKDKPSKLANTHMQLQPPVSKKKLVGPAEASKNKADRSVLDCNVAKPRSPQYEDTTHVGVCIKKAVKSTEAKQSSQVPAHMKIQKSPTMSGNERKQASYSFPVASAARMLRSRNKSVSYTEYNTDDHSSDDENVTTTSRKSKKITDYQIFSNDNLKNTSKTNGKITDQVSHNEGVKVTSRESKRVADYYSSGEEIVKTATRKSKIVTDEPSCSDEEVKGAANKTNRCTFGHSSSENIVKSTAIKSVPDLSTKSPSPTWTVSKTVPVEKLTKRPNDIYSINKFGSQTSKSAQQSIETKKQIWTKHRMEKTVTTMSYSKSVYSLSSDPYDFETESKTRSEDTVPIVPFRSHLFAKDNYKKLFSAPSNFNSTPDKANYKKQNNKQFALPSACSKQRIKNKSMNDLNVQSWTHVEDRKRISEPYTGRKQQNKLENKKSSPTDISVVKGTSREQKNRYSAGGSEIDINSDSDGGSSKYALYASQIEQDKSDTGLVFPHLDDSIPCTPLQQENNSEVLNATETKSLVSELSWLVQAKKNLDKQEQKKSKTYSGHNFTDTRHEATFEEDLELEPQYSRLHAKQASTTPDTLVQTSKLKTKAAMPGKHKLFSPLDIRTVSKSGDSDDENKTRTVKKIQKDKTLTSAFKNTTQDLPSSSQKKNKKNLSFRSPDIESSSSDLGGSICEDNCSLSKHHNTNPDLTVDNSDGSAQDIPSNARKQCDEFLNLVSAHLDQQLQDVTDSMCGGTECKLYTGNVSGPSSYIRPSKSQLKRKYPSLSTSVEESIGESDMGDVYGQDTRSGQKHSLVSRKLFKSGVTPLRPDQDTLSANKSKERKKATAQPKHDYQISQTVKHKRKGRGNWSHEHKISGRGDQTKHYSFSGGFDGKSLSTSQTGSKLTFDLCSPEKARSVMHSSEEDLTVGLELSPLIPLDLSSSNSPVIGFGDKSSLELDVDERSSLPQTSLLDSVRRELMKSRVSEVSDEVEMSAEVGVLDVNETASSGINSLQEFLVKQNIKKMPIGSDDIDGAVKSTHQAIVSLWETDQRKSMNAVEKFQSEAQKIFTQMNKNVKEMQEHEMKVNLLWSQEMDKIRRHSLAQRKSLTRLRKAHEELLCDLQGVHADGESSQKNLKAVMKQNLDALQRKLVAKHNDQALDAMRRCLHMSLLL